MFITSKDPYFTLSCQLCYGISESNLQATIVSAICLLLASYADFQLEYCAQFCAKWAFTQYSAGQNLLIFIDKSCIGCQFSSSPLLTRWIFSLPRAQSSGQVRWEGERVIYGGDQIPDTCFYTRLLNITIGIIYAPEHRDININLNQVCRLGPGINIYSQPAQISNAAVFYFNVYLFQFICVAMLLTFIANNQINPDSWNLSSLHIFTTIGLTYNIQCLSSPLN